MKQKIFLFLAFSIILHHIGFAQKKITGDEYIKAYKDLAIKEMKRTGIPASITMAQGMLESENGNSTLARKANNHFGIKCHNTWNGNTIKHHDDRKNECFRSYNSVYDSYHDHSEFLQNASRYDFLFKLKSTDYKGWARGLKQAGYATIRSYDNMLIKIIEENKLYLLDKEQNIPGTDTLTDIDNFSINLNKREVSRENNISYIITKEGDSFFNLAKEMDMMPWEIYKYNDLPKDASITTGIKLYIQPKRNKAAKGNDLHVTGDNETMYDVSQQYGVKLKKLYKMNLMKPGKELAPGDTIWLRKKKKPEDVSQGKPKEIDVIFYQ